MKLSLLPYIIYAFLSVGCTHSAIEAEESETIMPKSQQRSKIGTIVPGTTEKINFQIDQFLDANGKPDPGNYTVQFNLNDPNSVGAVQPKAEIEWVQSGNSVRRVIDVSDGASITGSGEGVIINVYTVVGSIFDPITVSLQVAKGTRATNPNPPIFSPPGGAAAVGPGADSLVIPIPRDIGASSAFVTIAPDVIGTAIGAYDILVAQCSDTAGTLPLSEYDPRQSDFVPFINGIRSLRIQTSAAAPTIIFYVYLGIDG